MQWSAEVARVSCTKARLNTAEDRVKALLEVAADPLTLARFLHEARNLASVEHRGLVPVYAVGQSTVLTTW